MYVIAATVHYKGMLQVGLGDMISLGNTDLCSLFVKPLFDQVKYEDFGQGSSIRNC